MVKVNHPYIEKIIKDCSDIFRQSFRVTKPKYKNNNKNSISLKYVYEYPQFCTDKRSLVYFHNKSMEEPYYKLIDSTAEQIEKVINNDRIKIKRRYSLGLDVAGKGPAGGITILIPKYVLEDMV